MATTRVDCCAVVKTQCQWAVAHSYKCTYRTPLLVPPPADKWHTTPAQSSSAHCIGSVNRSPAHRRWCRWPRWKGPRHERSAADRALVDCAVAASLCSSCLCARAGCAGGAMAEESLEEFFERVTALDTDQVFQRPVAPSLLCRCLRCVWLLSVPYCDNSACFFMHAAIATASHALLDLLVRRWTGRSTSCWTTRRQVPRPVCCVQNAGQ